MCILIEILQNSCKKLSIQDYSEYDLTKGVITTSVLKVKSPGQTKWVDLVFKDSGVTLIDNKILGIQRLINETLSDLSEGFYEFVIEVTQVKDGITTFSTQNFCYFNSCSIDCKIDQLQLDILAEKCCEDNDCKGKLSDSYKLLEDLKLYREGIKASAELCKKETVTDLYKCLKLKLETQNVDCKCK